MPIKKAWTDIKAIFTTPTALELAVLELEDAQRELLKAYTAREYADSVALYNETKISRLTVYLKANKK